MDIKNIRIEDLGLTVKTYNVFKHAKLFTLGEIMALSDKELFKIRDCGKTAVQEIRSKISELQKN